MIVPLLLFIAMNFALSMGGNNTNTYGGSSDSGGWGGRSRSVDDMFSLTRDPRRGFTVARHVEQVPEVQDVRLNYFVRHDFATLLQRRRLSTRSVELHVARQSRESFGRRCRSEVQKSSHATMRSATNRPQVCEDFQKLRHIPQV